MTKKEKNRKISITTILVHLMLIFAISATLSCEDILGDTDVDTTALQEAIASAKNEKSGVLTSADGEDVAAGTYWVTNIQMNTFNSAISSAEAAFMSASNQSSVNSATTALKSAINIFKGQKKSGTMAAAIKTELITKIAQAENVKSNVIIAASASEVASGLYFVTQAVMTIFENAISAAKGVRDNSSANQSVVDNATTALSQAITAFTGARAPGNKASGFTQNELTALITMANNTKTDVIISVNGDDVSPASYWVTSVDLAQFNTAITNAQTAANSGTGIDAAFNTLVTAMNTFNNTLKTQGTDTNKSKETLYDFIMDTEKFKTMVVTAPGKTQAPIGSAWATEAQWSLLNNAYTAALAVYNNPNATKNNVDQQSLALGNALITFGEAVLANGLGEKEGNTITITGLQEYNNVGISVGLVSSLTNISISETYDVYGTGLIQNGSVTIQLIDLKTSAVWVGNGSWYAGFRFDSESGGYPETYINSNAINFTANPNPSLSFTNFNKFAFQTTWGVIAEAYGEEFPSGNITLNTLFQAITGMTFEQVMEEGGMAVYKNSNMTQTFIGTDTVSAGTPLYAVFPFWMMGGNRGEKIGEITGTITLTDISNPPPIVYIYAGDTANYDWSVGRRIDLSGVTGSTTTVNWAIPVYESDNFSPSSKVEFNLSIRPSGYSDSLDIPITGTKSITAPSAAVGNMGSVSIKYITISGTINVTYSGNPVPHINIAAVTEQDGYFGYSKQLSSPAANTAWSIVTLPFPSSRNLTFTVYGYDDMYDLFTIEHEPNPKLSVYNSNITGININLGDIFESIEKTIIISGLLEF